MEQNRHLRLSVWVAALVMSAVAMPSFAGSCPESAKQLVTSMKKKCKPGETPDHYIDMVIVSVDVTQKARYGEAKLKLNGNTIEGDVTIANTADAAKALKAPKPEPSEGGLIPPWYRPEPWQMLQQGYHPFNAKTATKSKFTWDTKNDKVKLGIQALQLACEGIFAFGFGQTSSFVPGPYNALVLMPREHCLAAPPK